MTLATTQFCLAVGWVGITDANAGDQVDFVRRDFRKFEA